MEFVSICSMHDDIKAKAVKIQRLKTKDYDDAEDYKWDVDDLADDVDTLVGQAKEAGQRMEDCIVKRRNAIKNAIAELKRENPDIPKVVDVLSDGLRRGEGWQGR